MNTPLEYPKIPLRLEHEFEDHIMSDQNKEKVSQVRTSNIIKVATLLLTVLIAIVSAVVWAADTRSEIKDDTISIVDNAKKDIENNADDLYAKRYEFTRIDEALKNQAIDIDEIKREQKENGKKLDKLYNHLIKR